MPGFEEYYGVEEVGSSLVNHEKAYYRALQYLSDKVPFLTDRSQPVNAVLGGFNPRSGIVDKFNEFVQNIHPHSDNKAVFLDMNSRPFELIAHPEESPHKIRARLENLPLQPNSVDLMILDHTLEFMKDDAVKSAGDEIDHALNPNGLLLATIDLPKISSFLDSFVHSKANKLPIHIRDEKKAVKLLAPLVPVLIAEYNSGPVMDAAIIVMGKKNSQYPRFQEDSPYHFSEKNLRATPKGNFK